ncbi:hypothetical protein CA54_05450 [Symmachiella macrocystis]|uniref:Uncharacterized protein n=1 Tax=Symmachiella macrocystis TaxID=2527985 RepID=A0A5C6BK82_9PLAN|nr:hypothetical protein CA54_05450 [Symmachiella macrocystis]
MRFEQFKVQVWRISDSTVLLVALGGLFVINLAC